MGWRCTQAWVQILTLSFFELCGLGKQITPLSFRVLLFSGAMELTEG